MRWKGVAVFLGLFSIACFTSVTAVAQSQPGSRYANTRKPASASIRGPVDVEADTHFKRLLANQQVRVFSLTMAPGESTLLGKHPHDYLVISLGKNSIDAAGEANRFPLDMSDGEAQVLTGGWPHKLVNRAGEPATLLIVEIPRGIFPQQSVCGLASRPCSHIRFGNTDDGRYSQSMMFETKTIRLFRAELGPGGVLPEHLDRADHLIITLAQTQLAGLEAADGSVNWSPGGLGTVKNVDSKDARMLIVEIK